VLPVDPGGQVFAVGAAWWQLNNPTRS
jgi:hypothetical protein